MEGTIFSMKFVCPNCGCVATSQSCQRKKYDYYVDGGDYGVEVYTGICVSCLRFCVHSYYSFADRTVSWLKTDESKAITLADTKPFAGRKYALYTYSPMVFDTGVLDAFVKRFGRNDCFVIDVFPATERKLYYKRRKLEYLGIADRAWNMLDGLSVPNLFVENAICSQLYWGVELYSLIDAYRSDFRRFAVKGE